MTFVSNLGCHDGIQKVPETQYAVKVGDLQWVRIPPGQSVARPEAIRAMKDEQPVSTSHQRMTVPFIDPRGTRFLKHENCVEKRRLAAFETDLEYGLPQLHHLING